MSQTIICPKCRQVDFVRKVSAIVDEGISVAHYSGVAPIQTSDKTYWVPVQRESHSQTKLSQKLAFDSDRIFKRLDTIFNTNPLPNWMAAGLLIMSMVGLIIGVVVSDIMEVSPNFISMWIGMIGGALLWFLITMPFRPSDKIINERIKQRSQAYKSAKAKWHNLYYCGRCDIVLDPTTNKYASSDRMVDFLLELSIPG